MRSTATSVIADEVEKMERKHVFKNRLKRCEENEILPKKASV